MPAEASVQNVSDTARWVAMYRAMESERPDALFHDPFARRLAGEQGARIVEEMPGGPKNAWTFVVRTAVLDEIILREVRAGADLVLNLAAGLDTRPYRLDLPKTLRWVEVDFAPMIEAKTALLEGEVPRCRLERRACDLSDPEARRALFRDLGGSASRVVVVTEGLLLYLTADQVRSLAEDLRALPNLSGWLFDNVGTEILRFLQKSWGRTLKNAELKFGLDDVAGFFEPLRFRLDEYRPTLTEALRLKRDPPFGFFVRIAAKFSPERTREKVRKMAGYALLRPV